MQRRNPDLLARIRTAMGLPQRLATAPTDSRRWFVQIEIEKFLHRITLTRK